MKSFVLQCFKERVGRKSEKKAENIWWNEKNTVSLQSKLVTERWVSG